MGPNRTATIAFPPVAEVRSIFALRCSIEPEFVAEVAHFLTKDGEAMLRRHLECEQVARDADWGEVVRLSGLFHSVIASLSENRLAASCVSELVDRSLLAIHLYQRPGSVVCMNEENIGMMRTMARRDAEGSRSAVADYLNHTLSRLNLKMSPDSAPAFREPFQGTV